MLPNLANPSPKRWPDLSVTLIYIVIGLLWITFSDRLLSEFQTFKGIAYVLLTGLILYFLLRFFYQSLRQQHSYYRLLFEQNPIPMWICDPQSAHILDSNQAAVERYGFSVSEFKQLNLKDLETNQAGLAFDAWSHGKEQLALTHHNQQGQIIDIELQFQLTPQGMLVAAYDLREHKALEQSLTLANESLIQFQQTIHSATILALLDEHGNIQDANSSMQQLLHLSLEQLKHYRLEDLCLSLQPQWVNMREKLETETSCRGEMAFAKNWVSFMLVKYGEDEEGTYLLLGQEVTSQKKLQAELWDLNHQLLRQNKNLSQFSQIISHHLRQPVANLLGLASLLKQANVLETQDLLEKVENSAQEIDSRLHDVNQILIEKNQSQLSLDWLNLKELIEILLADKAVSEKHYELSFHLQIERILSEPNYIQSILKHLIGFAFQCQQADTVLNLHFSSEWKDGAVELKLNCTGLDIQTSTETFTNRYENLLEQFNEESLGLYLAQTQIEILGGHIKIDVLQAHTMAFVVRVPQPGVPV